MRRLFDDTKLMDNVTDIYHQMKANCPNPCSTSKKLWEFRRARDIADHNDSPEKMLECAVAMLAARGRMPGWYNQCPTASGITDASVSRQASKNANKHSDVDLVHWDEASKCARLVELKWESDDPLSALRQILRYGTAYIFCLAHRGQLNFPAESLIEMNVRHVSLEVIAPRRFYNGYNKKNRFERISQDLDEFAGSKTGGTLTMSLDALAFPDGFQIPFNGGADVKDKCDTHRLTSEGQAVRDAFANLTQVWPQS